MRKRSIPFSAGIRKCLAAGKTIVAGEKASACPRLLCLLILLLFFACDDPVENPVSAAGRLQTVPVLLSVELAEETDGAAQSPAATAGAPTGRAAGTTALESELLPAVRTKTTTAVPDKLYTLDIYQYTAAGVYLTYASLGDKEIGERFTTQLSDNGGNDCQPTAYGYSVRSYTATIERPLTFYIYAQTSSEYPNAFKDVPDPWGGTSNKTLYDPCPQGWRVPANEYMLQSKNAELSMMAGFGSTASDWVPEALYPVSSANLQYYDGEKLRPFGSGNVAQSDVVGSGYIYTGASGDAMSVDRITDKSAFFPGVSLRELDTGAYRTSEGGVPIKNNTIYLWSSSFSNVDNQLYIYQFQSSKLYFQHGIPRSYGFSVRCIQDRSVR